MQAATRRNFVIGLAGVGLGLYACRRAGRAVEPEMEKRQAAPAAGAPEPASAGLPQRTLGRSGERVSALGLGGYHIGNPDRDQDAIRLIRSAIDEGVTFLDNCWDYHEGRSEERMGQALADGYRKRVFLMTKIDARNAPAATAQLEQSLKRLKTDVIDLVQIHEVIRSDDPARCFAPGGAIEALVAAKQAGKLRLIGFTGHKHPDIHLAMLRTAREHGFHFDAVQMPLNVMDAHYSSFEHKVLPVLLEQGIGVLGMKSMAAGHILESGVVTPEECLRYALSLPTSVVISGVDNLDLLRKNIAIARGFRPLTEAEKSAILRKTETMARAGRYEPFKTGTEFDGTARNPHWLLEARI